MYTSHFFIQLVWFSSVSHTTHNLLLSTESFNSLCLWESLQVTMLNLLFSPSFKTAQLAISFCDCFWFSINFLFHSDNVKLFGKVWNRQYAMDNSGIAKKKKGLRAVFEWKINSSKIYILKWQHLIHVWKIDFFYYWKYVERKSPRRWALIDLHSTKGFVHGGGGGSLKPPPPPPPSGRDRVKNDLVHVHVYTFERLVFIIRQVGSRTDRTFIAPGNSLARPVY